jgi:hypothetical protein
MDRLFKDVRYIVCPYIDNIIIFSRTKEEYLEDITEVLTILEEVGIYIGPKKSFIGYLVV